ncbi:MAG: hypothetical protein K8U03_06295 [Planctomycetia bacterium]|nr:hypothetical protein [Planctomycetia bacterium]
MDVVPERFPSADIEQSLERNQEYRRTATLAFAIVIGLIPLLYYFTSTADGAEPTRSTSRPSGKSPNGSSLKWRAAGSRASASSPTVDEAAAVEATPAEPKQLEAAADAKPITAKSSEPEAKRAPELRRDNQIRLTQATNPLANPLADPFGDAKPTAPAPRLLTTEPKSPLNSNATVPPLPRADQLAIINGGFQQEECPKLSDLKPISKISNVIAASQGDLPRECYFDETVIGPMNRNWLATTYTWKASGLCHKPLYFEEVALERYGHSTGPISQPIVSGAHFFATLPLLPYKMGLNPPWECKYALGYYRPGSCAPYIVPPIPISGRAIAAEAAAVSGAIFLFP